MTHSDTSAALPLSGHTVLDLSGTVATATCGKLFADFGARVINVEPPGRGHPTRSLLPLFPGAAGSEASGLHALLSPHKESVTIDIADVGRRGQLEAWLVGTDVVLEAEEPGRLAGQGLGMEQLGLLAPELTVCSLTWWGQDGPLADMPANDAAVRAQTGQVFVTGPVAGPPILPAGHQVEILGGVTAFVSALHSLAGRALGNVRGPMHIDVSLFEASMCLTETGATAAAASLLPPRRLGVNRFAPTFPMGIYPTCEGWLGVSVLTPSQWLAFCNLIGIDDLAQIPEYQATLGRLADADAIEAVMRPALMKRTAREWFERGQARRIPLALVPSMEELLHGEQMRARGSFRAISHPGHGDIEAPTVPFGLHDTPARVDGPVARLGEHRAPPAGRASRDGHVTSRRLPLPTGSPDPRPAILSGVRVLDLSMGWAGPLAARHLADVGAEVIKIESRQHFDWWRGWEATPESLAQSAHERANAFNIMNRNKLGITLDLSHPRGAEILRDLVAMSHVVLENYSAGVLPKLGLDWAAVHAINPRLVMLSMPPFGAGGPWHSYRAYGSTVEQASGLPHLHGGPDDPPVMQHVALGDPVAGVHGAAALMVALLHLLRSGEGQFLDLSQVESVAHLGLHGIASQVILDHAAPRTGNRHPVHAPQGVYRAADDDRWLMLTVDSAEAWEGLVHCIGDAELEDGEFADVSARQAGHDTIDDCIERWTRGKDRDEAVARLQEAGVVASPVLTAREVFAHPQLSARGFWRTLEREFVGAIPHPVAPYRFNGLPAEIAWPAPTLGQHSAEVLSRLLGLDGAELARLEEEGVIGATPAMRGRAIDR